MEPRVPAWRCGIQTREQTCDEAAISRSAKSKLDDVESRRRYVKDKPISEKIRNKTARQQKRPKAEHPKTHRNDKAYGDSDDDEHSSFSGSEYISLVKNGRVVRGSTEELSEDEVTSDAISEDEMVNARETRRRKSPPIVQRHQYRGGRTMSSREHENNVRRPTSVGLSHNGQSIADVAITNKKGTVKKSNLRTSWDPTFPASHKSMVDLGRSGADSRERSRRSRSLSPGVTLDEHPDVTRRRERTHHQQLKGIHINLYCLAKHGFTM